MCAELVSSVVLSRRRDQRAASLKDDGLVFTSYHIDTATMLACLFSPALALSQGHASTLQKPRPCHVLTFARFLGTS